MTKYFSGANFGYWHWMADLWLVYTRDDLTAEQLHDSLIQLAPQASLLVTRVLNEDWAIRSPEKWHDWLHKNWTRPEP